MATTQYMPRMFHTDVVKMAPGSQVRVGGWVVTYTSEEVTVSDYTGTTRVLLSGVPEAQNLALNEGDVVDIIGTVEGGVVRAESFTIHNRTHKVEASEKEPLGSKSYLNFRNLDRVNLFRAANRAEKAAREYFSGKGFIEIRTPILWRSVQEYAEPEFRAYHMNTPNKGYGLLQSPMPPSLLGGIGGLDRTFQFARCIRWEGNIADQRKVAEFTQLNFTMTFMTLEESKQLIEGLTAALIKELTGEEVKFPYPRLSFEESMRKYGTDSPDYRYKDFLQPTFTAAQVGRSEGKFYGLVIPGALPDNLRADLAEMIGKRFGEFGITAIAPDGSVKTLGTLGLVEDILDWTKSYGVKLPATLVVLPGPGHRARLYYSSIIPNIRPVVDPTPVPKFAFVWVSEPPYLADPPEEGLPEVFGTFHGSRSVLGRTLPPEKPGDPVRVVQHDLIMNGLEVAAGGEKEHKLEEVKRNWEYAKVDDTDFRFGYHMEALQVGAPPLLNSVVGWDRFLWKVLAPEALYDLILLPKNTAGVCKVAGLPEDLR